MYALPIVSRPSLRARRMACISRRRTRHGRDLPRHLPKWASRSRHRRRRPRQVARKRKSLETDSDSQRIRMRREGASQSRLKQERRRVAMHDEEQSTQARIHRNRERMLHVHRKRGCFILMRLLKLASATRTSDLLLSPVLTRTRHPQPRCGLRTRHRVSCARSCPTTSAIHHTYPTSPTMVLRKSRSDHVRHTTTQARLLLAPKRATRQ